MSERFREAMKAARRTANKMLRAGHGLRAYGMHDGLNLLAKEFERLAMGQYWETYTEVRFESAHHLPAMPEGHKCRRMHGHSYRARVYVQGAKLDERYITTDYADIAAAVSPLVEQLDHHCLNDIEGLENPTSEVIAAWIWERLKPDLPGLVRIRIFETCDSGCTYSAW